MDIQIEKYRLIEWIANQKDASVIKKLKEVVSNSSNFDSPLIEFHSEISIEQKQLLDDRLKEHENNPTDGKSWNEVKSELSEKYGL